MRSRQLPRSLTFHDYLLGRRYRSGRGSKEGWQFVARALGDPQLPDALSWEELQDYLRECGEDERLIRAAKGVWRSYISRLVRIRAGQRELMPVRHTQAPPQALCGLGK